jgi:hypothetical protein
MVFVLDLVGLSWLLVVEALLERASVGVLKGGGSMELQTGKRARRGVAGGLTYPRPIQCKQAQRVSYHYHYRGRRGRSGFGFSF